jgi:type III pantothenate kinase
MLLAIDVGNTHTVIGVFNDDTLVDHWRIGTEAHRTADELALLIRGFLSLGDSTAHADIRGVAVCSVVPSVTHEMREMTQRHFGLVALVVEPGVRTGVPILTDNPKEVGADRILNAVAAVHLYGGPCVVIDFGTATTFDAISAKGEYLGGAIAPGVEMSVEALGQRGAQLREVELAKPRSVIGRHTVEALQSGILYGFAGQVDGIVTRFVAELGDSARVIATGGLAPLLLRECVSIEIHEPWLTLVGLRLVYEKNASA